MKRLFKVFVLSLLFISFAQADTLKEGFLNPPNAAKPGTWWHWVDGNVTKTGITADLESMHRVGIHEAQIFNPDVGYPTGPLHYLSNEWLEMTRFAVSEAKRLGMEIGFHNSAGWSSSGGPWITPENAMKTVCFTDTLIAGDRLLKIKLTQPATRHNFYHDIAVWAFPAPRGKERVNNLDSKIQSGLKYVVHGAHVEPDLKVIGSESIIRKVDMVNLTSRMSADGSLKWNAPKGKWIILRMGYTASGATNGPSRGANQGLECDKLSRKALDVFWKGGIEPVLKNLGPLVGPTFNNLLIDSYEKGCCNWTEDFSEEFQRRRGYSLFSWLPVLAGYYLESGEKTERFLWDFRKTICELTDENYYGHFSQLCHEHGLKFSAEPYYGPFDDLPVAQMCDIPMTEFWVGQTSVNTSSRIVTSAAHLNGTPYVGAEAFTALAGQARYVVHPALLKSLGDEAWTEGVNRFIFHTFVHQPWNVSPGLLLGEYGSAFNRLNTWWEQSKAYMQYVARSQYLLQQGRNIADILFFVGESSPNNGFYLSEIKQLGFDYDLIDTAGLSRMTVEQGHLKTAVGGDYQLLVLPHEEPMMTPEFLYLLRRLVRSGVHVIGPKPQISPSLQNYPQCDNEVKALADELWGKDANSKGPIRDIPVAEALKTLNDVPDFQTNSPDIAYIHRRTADADIYFVSNQKDACCSVTATFRINGREPELWNAETGNILPLVCCQTSGQQTTLPLKFRPNESYFIIFRNNQSVKNKQIVKLEETTHDSLNTSHLALEDGRLTWITPKIGQILCTDVSGQSFQATIKKLPKTICLDGSWKVTFPFPEKSLDTVFPKLTSWTENSNDSIKYFSGTVTYQREINVPKSYLKRDLSLELDLGKVDVIAEVWVNGKNLGILWHAPYSMELGRAVKAGKNQLEIRITNLWVNRLIGDEQYPEDVQRKGPIVSEWPAWLNDPGKRQSKRTTFCAYKKWSQGESLQSSGLLGPVVIRPYVHQTVSPIRNSKK